MKKLPYREGDWIALPLRDGSGYAVGRIARMAPEGKVLLGYFFGRRFRERPELKEVRDLHPKEASLVRKFGDLGLIRGEWAVLGGADDWRREEWPMPVFARKSPLDERAWKVHYTDDNPNATPRPTAIPPDEVGNYPDDATLGAGLVEILLTRTISNGNVN